MANLHRGMLSPVLIYLDDTCTCLHFYTHIPLDHTSKCDLFFRINIQLLQVTSSAVPYHFTHARIKQNSMKRGGYYIILYNKNTWFIYIHTQDKIKYVIVTLTLQFVGPSSWAQYHPQVLHQLRQYMFQQILLLLAMEAWLMFLWNLAYVQQDEVRFAQR